MGDTAAFRQAADGRSAVIFRLPVTPGELSDLRVYGPIIGRHDRVEAVLVARVNDKLLYETLADLYSPVSQHISLLNDEGIMIPCELIDGAVLHHPTQAPAAVAAMARQHARTVMRYTAADGREIIAAFQWIPSLGWGVLAERDADEAFGTFNRWRVLIGAAALFVVAVGVALNTMLANRMMRRLQKRERELQTTHEQLITADRLASVGMMAASIAHEVNNPLTTIKVLMHSVAERVPRSAQVGDDLDIVQSEIDKIKALILRFLQFARPKEPEFIVLDLNDILRRVVLLIRPQAEGRDIAVAESYHDELPSIRADGSQLGQVILNLLFNAIEAAPDGGRIRITTKTLPNGHVEAGIWNSGPGLSEELTERVFEPFFSTKATGTGLGLPIARMIIDKHRGSLTARGHGSEGTTFIIHLPSDRPDTDDASRISR
jgi:signal transduction histidine kinase